jgi:hypothetical protein
MRAVHGDVVAGVVREEHERGRLVDRLAEEGVLDAEMCATFEGTLVELGGRAPLHHGARS